MMMHYEDLERGYNEAPTLSLCNSTTRTRKVVKFTVVHSATLKILTVAVDTQLKNGWELRGELQAHSHTHDVDWYQVMVKYAEEGE